jgi:hypothetical protein
LLGYEQISLPLVGLCTGQWWVVDCLLVTKGKAIMQSLLK